MTIKTDRDARDYLIQAIEAGDAQAEEYDVDAILADMRELAGGWQFEVIDPETFWKVIEKNAR